MSALSTDGTNVTNTLLEITDLHITFGTNRPAVNGISLEVRTGEVLALVGESGSGKSMTARAVLGLLPVTARATGSIRLQGTEILGLGEAELNKIRGSRVAMVFQEPQTALNPVRTVGWQIMEALRAHGDISRGGARTRAAQLLAQVEIPSPEERLDYYPHQLSGGQKQRVVLALALANEPELLLADEPTTALDVTVQAEILALLNRIRGDLGMSILLITHNVGVVAQMADRVVVLKDGDIVETERTEQLFRDPQHRYTRDLLAAVPRLPASDVHDAAARTEPVVIIPPEQQAAVRLEDVTVVYPGRHGRPAFTAVSGVSLAAAPGEVLGLVGESGSGKTTLGRVIAGLVPVARGRVLVEGADLAELSAARLRETRRHLAFVHQDPAASLDPRLSIEASIREPLDVHRVGDRASRTKRVLELLDAVRLPGSFAHRLPRELSGGQRQRVAMARALALRPALLIADEPTSALDVSVQADVLALFSDLQQEFAFTCIFISHDLAVVYQVSDRVAVLRDGEVVEEGPVEDVFTHPSHAYTRALLDAVPVPDPSVRRLTYAR